MSTSVCELSIPEVEGLQSQQLTVGREFIFKCSGELPVHFNVAEARLASNENYKYDLVLRKVVVQDASHFDLYVVSYVAGLVRIPEIYVTDGVNQIAIRTTEYKVDSVLPPPQQIQAGAELPSKPEPYGYTATHLIWPLSYTVFFVFLSCVLITLILQQWGRQIRRRRLLKELKHYDSALSADSQFYKGLRVLEKQNYPISEVEKQFRLYVIRKYQVPLFGMTINESIRFLKKKWPTYISERRDLKNILLDLKKMSEDVSSKNTEAAKVPDTRNYLKKIYKFIDDTEERMKNQRLEDQS